MAQEVNPYPLTLRVKMPPPGKTLVLQADPARVGPGMGKNGDPDRYRSSDTKAAEASEEGDLAPKPPVDLEEFLGIDWPHNGSLVTSAHPLCRLS